jgi:hypothetical protein
MSRYPYQPGPWGSPQAPVWLKGVTISSIYGEIPYTGSALLDTGASHSGIPFSWAEKNGWHVCRRLSVASAATEEAAWLWTYAVQIVTPFGIEDNVEAYGTHQPYALIGRDYLNKRVIKLDGPCLEFCLARQRWWWPW